MRILIADDDAQDCAVLSNFLTRKGHYVRTVDRGTDALEVAPVLACGARSGRSIGSLLIPMTRPDLQN